MKAETEKKIYDLMNYIQYAIHDDAISVKLCNDLKDILVCEAHDTRWGKLDVYKYVCNDKTRLMMTGVHYSDGWRVATDGRILIKLRDNLYPEGHEGKTIDKTGKAIEGRYPNYNAVMPLDISGYDEVQIDYDALADVVKRAKVHKKLYGDDKFQCRYYVKVGNQYYSVWLFEKFAKALKANNINRFFENPQKYHAVFKNENIEILMMGVNYNEDELNNRDESLFIAKI